MLKRAREGEEGDGRRGGGVWNHTAVLFILNQSTRMLTHTLTYTHSRGRHYSCEQMAPHKHSMKATSTVACDTVAKNKWDQLYTLLVSRTCRTEGGNMSTPAHTHTHTEWFSEYSASKLQLLKPAFLFSFLHLIHDATSQLRASKCLYKQIRYYCDLRTKNHITTSAYAIKQSPVSKSWGAFRHFSGLNNKDGLMAIVRVF